MTKKVLPNIDTKCAKRQILSCTNYVALKDAFLTFVDAQVGNERTKCAFYIVDPEYPDFWFILRRRTRTLALPKGKRRIPGDIISAAMHLSKSHFITSQDTLKNLLTSVPIKDLTMPLVFMPLRREKTVSGLIHLSLPCNVRKTLEMKMKKVFALSPSIGIALDHCHTHESERARTEELVKVAQLSAELQLIKKTVALSEAILSSVIATFDFDRIILCSVDLDTNHLKGIASKGYESTYTLIECPVKSTIELFAKVTRSGNPEVVRNIKTQEGLPEFIVQTKDVGHGILIPLSARGKGVGVLWAEYKTDRAQFTRGRIEALGLFGKHAGTALANARLFESIEHTAETDALTEVYNRHYFDKIIKREISRIKRYKYPLSMMMIDVADFKRFNDLYGHVMGDEMLRRVAHILSSNVRETDVVARYGGDEFVVLMPNTDHVQAGFLQERIKRAVGEHNRQPANDRYQIELSIGLRTGKADTVERIIEEADRAMYKQREDNLRHHILEVLSTSTQEDITKWDHFVASVAKVLYEKELFFMEHSRRVLRYSRRMCDELNLQNEYRESICLASLLHDIGKISIDYNLLNKTGPLTAEEYEIIKTHSALGEDLFKGAEYLAEMREIIKYHHERYDGATSGEFPGYPEGLKGEQISLGARILKITDAYDAITSNRPYRKARSRQTAIEELKCQSGKSFDPKLVDIFITSLNK